MNLHFIDSENIKLVFSSLVINAVKLQEKNFNIKDYVQDHDLNCKTNGKLIVMHEMISSHPDLSNFVSKHLIPLGLEVGEDYIFIEEQLLEGVQGKETCSYLGQELPETRSLTWLSSKMTADGCFVYYENLKEDRFGYLYDLSVEELVDRLNQEVGNTGWTSSRGEYLVKLKKAFDIKGVECESYDLKNKKVLVGNKLVNDKLPGGKYKLSTPNGDSTDLSIREAPFSTNIDLGLFEAVSRIQFQDKKSYMFELNNSENKYEILTIENDIVSASTVMIGHLNNDLRQLVFGKDFIVIPRNYSFTKTPLNSKLSIK